MNTNEQLLTNVNTEKKDVVLYLTMTVLLFHFVCGAGNTWAVNPLYNNFLSLVFLSLLMVTNGKAFFATDKKLLFVLFFLLAILFSYSRGSSYIGYINQFLFVSVIAMIILLQRQYKRELLDFFTKWLAVVLCISLGFYVLVKMGVLSLPYTVYIPSEELETNGSMYVFKNYFFFTEFYYEYFGETIIPRFQAFFIEPSYLGTICLVLIIANEFNFKNRYVTVLFLMMLLSLSLAAYLIFMYSFLLHLFFFRNKGSFIVLILLVAVICIWINTLISEEENIVNTYIFNRLFSDGRFEFVSNRSKEEFDVFFWNIFCKSDNFFWGNDDYAIQFAADTKSVDYKYFFVHYGIWGTFWYLLNICVLYFQHCNKKTFILLSAWIAILFQAAWLGQYFTYIVPIILGTFLMSTQDADISQEEPTHDS